MNEFESSEDKRAIDEVQRRFSLAVDAKNFAEISRLFTTDGIVRFNGEIGIDQFVATFSETQKTVDTQHFGVNSVSLISGDRAVSSSYFFAYHRVPAKCQDETIGRIYGRYEVDTDLFQGGTYDDELVRTPDGWRFEVRTVGILWGQTMPSNERLKSGWTLPIIFR